MYEGLEMKPETPTKQELIDAVNYLAKRIRWVDGGLPSIHAETIKYCMENGK